MAVFTATVTVGTSSTTTTFTGWAPYVAVTVPAGAANSVYVTTDGSTPTVAGADAVACPIGTTYLRNRTERPEITATTPLATDPSAPGAFTAAATPVKGIGTASVAGVTISLVSSAGVQPVIG